MADELLLEPAREWDMLSYGRRYYSCIFLSRPPKFIISGSCLLKSYKQGASQNSQQPSGVPTTLKACAPDLAPTVQNSVHEPRGLRAIATQLLSTVVLILKGQQEMHKNKQTQNC